MNVAPMRKTALLAGALAVCLAVALGCLAYLLQTVRRQAAEADRLARENHALLARAPVVPPVAPAPGPAPEHEHTAAPGSPRPAPGLPQTDLQAVVDSTRASLAEANASITQLETRVQDLQVQVQKLSLDSQRLTASEAYLKDELASANRLVAAQQQELKTRTDRVVQLEIAAGKLHEDATANNGKLAQLAQLSTELQEIHRRRENLLNAILRRYKEVTDQYRAMAGVMDSRAHNEGPAVPAADVARIQNSLSLAEDDLRQLNNLSAQALLLQKKLVAK